jgi:hypothetical protein
VNFTEDPGPTFNNVLIANILLTVVVLSIISFVLGLLLGLISYKNHSYSRRYFRASSIMLLSLEVISFWAILGKLIMNLS